MPRQYAMHNSFNITHAQINSIQGNDTGVVVTMDVAESPLQSEIKTDHVSLPMYAAR